ncbi:E3 ubiquitin-protein ligase Rnf220-like [Ctenocephalides felis]|uniref:E3 ubiquitin-protein ligase Rnf220-like n=1 Tax=Ctenocephalides felis TaxID=7515 RepID=UPI000E6E59E0|nr:E3 ubiquitin-protein ligase Rnf220-like [Ctenocephalides felis]
MDLASTTTVEEGRGFRTRRKLSDFSCCPVCGITLRTPELESHYVLEMEKLNKLSTCRTRKASLGSSSNENGSTSANTVENSWDTFQKIKSNRQSRLKANTRKRKADGTLCPVCNERTNDDISVHVELCLRKNSDSPDDENIDVEGDGESFEEYEWAGQQRIRASSLLVGGYQSAGVGTSISKCHASSEDEDLIVDGDDSSTFGPPQYSESDVVVPTVDSQQEAKELQALRGALLENIAGKPPTEAVVVVNKNITGSLSSEIPSTVSKNPTMDALQAKIRELEVKISDRESGEQYKCLICMDSYKNAVVSVCCWHVHCEECWLHTLGAKKLCPQCNMITSPLDLRRIYL